MTTVKSSAVRFSATHAYDDDDADDADSLSVSCSFCVDRATTADGGVDGFGGCTLLAAAIT